MNTKDCDKKVAALIETLWNDATDNEYGDCDECTYAVHQSQRHPYGGTSTTETWCECAVEEPKDCPVVEQVVATIYNLVMTVTKKESA